MPVSKGAEKKLRKDVKRTIANHSLKKTLKKTIKTARTNPTAATISDVFKKTDKAVKKHLMHKNKAARIKSAISKLLATPKK